MFGKGKENVVDWIERGFATYINKEKALDYLRISALHAEAQSKERLSRAAKIVKDFENPKSGNIWHELGVREEELFRDGDAAGHEQAAYRAEYERMKGGGWFQSAEALQDSMLSLKNSMLGIVKAGGGKVRIEEIAGHENLYMGENRLASQNQAEARHDLGGAFRGF